MDLPDMERDGDGRRARAWRTTCLHPAAGTDSSKVNAVVPGSEIEPSDSYLKMLGLEIYRLEYLVPPAQETGPAYQDGSVRGRVRASIAGGCPEV